MGTLTTSANTVLRRTPVGAGPYLLRPDDRQAAENASHTQDLNALLLAEVSALGRATENQQAFYSLRAFRFNPTRLNQTDGFIVALDVTQHHYHPERKVIHQTSLFAGTYFVGRDQSVSVLDNNSAWIPLQKSPQARLEEPANIAELVLMNRAADIAAIGAKIPVPVGRVDHRVTL